MIVIAEPDPRWGPAFEEEKTRLAAACGPLLEAAEHIGSTSVPGLAAKPIIDILAGVRSIADADRCVPLLQGLGYTYVPEYENVMPFRRYFKKLRPDGSHSHHVHMVEITHSFWADHLLFRDYLRHHPRAAAAYAELKRSLARVHTDMNSYAESKTEFIQAALAAARRV